MIKGKIDDWELKIKRFERKIKRVTKIDRLFILEHDKIDKYIDKKKR